MSKKLSLKKLYITVTKKPLLFYSFVIFGIILFLFLAITTKVDSSRGEVSLLYMIFIKAGKGV